MNNLPEIFGTLVFDEKAMRESLPKDIYRAMRKTIESGQHLEIDVANAVAHAMKVWAVSKGATHFTHWFQPMTGITAEKHDSFISPDGNGRVIMEFSGKELVRGEPDASSFPSGGLRATFEARGYTAWDPSSYAFIKDNTLCIPTAFCSYSGEALDKKTPLLRSMQAIDKQAMRILRVLGDTTASRVTTTVGAEQEYFLIDKDIYLKRPDLMYTGRTLFGARPPKGQEMDDHYFGTIKPRVAAYMKDLDEQLWKLGVMAKTEHNEVAPAQHELAPIYATTNIATDHNQLTMELMKSTAAKHNLACLLHEKPFAGVNGSGKHNNWSISTDTGVNLLEPGKSPSHNERFLIFLCAVIKAVDEYQDLMRVSVASAGNDHRLGAAEAPPAIVSIFLGDELTELLEAFANDKTHEDKQKTMMEIGAVVLPHIKRDTTDRNRTSPFAFTGNKFEFRMLGSTFSVAGPNIVLNTIVAEALSHFADALEVSTCVSEDIHEIVKNTFVKHRRIIYNGNNYSEEWTREAEKRGLLNLPSTPEALPTFTAEKNVKMFVRQGVFTEAEVYSRYEILMENYAKTIHIEALTMIDMTKRDILPAALAFETKMCRLAKMKKELGIERATVENTLIDRLAKLTDSLYAKLEALEMSVISLKDCRDITDEALYCRKTIFANMQELRFIADELETITSSEDWPLPSYAEMLYSVN